MGEQYTSLLPTITLGRNDTRSMFKCDSPAENMALMRRMAVNMVRVAKEQKKSSMRSKLKRAAWNDSYLLELIIGAKIQLNEIEKV